MDDRKVADYFVVAGLDWNRPFTLLNESSLKSSSTSKLDPIVELAVINVTLQEKPPENFKCIEYTQMGFPADLNHGSLRAPEMFLCFRRGRDLPPIVDVGVLYENKDNKERLYPGWEAIYKTPYGNLANVNNTSGTKIFITFSRAPPTAPPDVLVVMEICIVLPKKGEIAPHAHCLVGKNLNKGVVGSDVFLCYKKSMTKTNYLTFTPSVISRYPEEDLPNLPLSDQVSMFCLPMGSTIETWPSHAQSPTPVFSNFILTGSLSGEKLYGSAVIFYEELLPGQLEKLNESQRKVLAGEEVRQNKSICLLSRFPFFDTFKKFLFFLYRIVFSQVDPLTHQIPLERHIQHFLTNIPVPSIQRPRIMIQLSSISIILSQPDETPLPKSGASFIDVLENLGATNSAILLLCALMEHKLLIHSLRPAVLASVSEAITAMMFPLHWQCPYIPLCPLNLSEFISSPTPFIIGVDSRYFDSYELPPDVTCVDLDNKNIHMSEDRKLHNLKMMPKRPMKQLKSSLEKLYDQLQELHKQPTPATPAAPAASKPFGANFDLEDAKGKIKVNLELQIREAFLRFMAHILKGYHQHLLPVTPQVKGHMNINLLFDVVGFMKTQDKSYHKFYALLLKTQAFSRFIEERSFVSDKDSSLAFFDDCLSKVDDLRENQKLIELEDTLGSIISSERTVLIMPPEPETTDQTIYNYNCHFPLLNSKNFSSVVTPSNQSQSDGFSNSPFTPTSSNCSSKPPLKPLCHGYVGSPMVCRTQHEVKQSHKIAIRHMNKPEAWAKFLVWQCYSLWFFHLSSYVKTVHSKSKTLKFAFQTLGAIQFLRSQIPDEMCYRVLMQLCGIYQQPILATQLLCQMKKKNIQPNAITYGFYNKVLIESKWPNSNSTPDQLWIKLRNVVFAAAKFRRFSTGSLSNTNHNNSCLSTIHPNDKSSAYESDKQSIDSFLSDAETNFDRKFSHVSLDTGHGIEMEEKGEKEKTGNPRSSILLQKGGEIPQDFFKQKASSANAVGEGGLGGGMKKGNESISAGGLSDRGYSSLSIEESFKVNLSQSRVVVTENDPLGHFSPLQEAPPPQALKSPSKQDSFIMEPFKNQHFLSNQPQESKPSKSSSWVTKATEGLLKKEELLDFSLRMANKFTSRFKEDYKSKRNESLDESRESFSSLNSKWEDSDQVQNTPSSSQNTPLQPEILETTVHDSEAAIDITIPTTHKNVSFQDNKIIYPPIVSNIFGGLKSITKSEVLVGFASTFNHASTKFKASLLQKGEAGVEEGGKEEEEDDFEENDESDVINDPDQESVVSSNENSNHSNNSNQRIKFNPSPMNNINLNTNLPEFNVQLFPIQIIMTTTNKCRSCKNLLFDEEVMAGWSTDDSNLKTSCQFCSSEWVPHINIYIKDYRKSIQHSSFSMDHPSSEASLFSKPEEFSNRKYSSASCLSAEPVEVGKLSGSVDLLNKKQSNSQVIDDPLTSSSASQSITYKCIELDPLCFPYLSPLVLRKELENLLEAEGEECFDDVQFIDGHSILFWNLVWFFKRINVPSHLISLIPYCSLFNTSSSSSPAPPPSYSSQKSLVAIHTHWDNPHLHGDHGPPMYKAWSEDFSSDKGIFSKEKMNEIVESIMNNDVTSPLKLILKQRSNLQMNSSSPLLFHSIYRDLLFLSFVTLGRENIDIDSFDKEYRLMLQTLSNVDQMNLKLADRSPKYSALYCRKNFSDLIIL